MHRPKSISPNGKLIICSLFNKLWENAMSYFWVKNNLNTLKRKIIFSKFSNSSFKCGSGKKSPSVNEMYYWWKLLYLTNLAKTCRRLEIK